MRFGSNLSENSFVKGRSRGDTGSTISDDANSMRSDDSQDSFDITDFVMHNVSGSRNSFQSSEALANDLAYLNKNLEEYVLSLSELLFIYDRMKSISPDKIRQHFDLPMKLVKTMFELQCDINKRIRDSNDNIGTIAKNFMDERFVSYQQYMIMSPVIYEALRNYKEHFELNYPCFKSLIILPSSKLNFYVQTLISFQNFVSPVEKNNLESSIEYLEDLKRSANTEMTIKIIKESPIDLHLGGKIVQVGELNYVNGPLSKRSYYVIAFENLFVVTISKVSYCIYVVHYRPEQILSVGGDGQFELIITTASSIHGKSDEHKFRNADKILDKWFQLIDGWVTDEVASYEIANDYNYRHDISNYVSGKNFPISLWQVFPFLRKLYQENCGKTFTKQVNVNSFCSVLIEKETEYIEKLNNIFNPETLPPPSELKDLLQRILNLHELCFLPELKQALKKNSTLVIDIFMNYLERFSEYKTYMIKRSLCTTQMPDGVRAQYYITPIQHLAFYVEWSRDLGSVEMFREASSYAVDTLLTYITDAKVMLLHEVIPNCCLDFYRTGELKKGGQVDIRVRPRMKGLRDGSYLVLLFEKVILILRTISPVYNLVFDMWLYQTNIGPPSENPNAFKLEYRQGKNKSHVTLEFKTQSEASKNEWLGQLSNELHSQAEEIKKCTAIKSYA